MDTETELVHGPEDEARRLACETMAEIDGLLGRLQRWFEVLPINELPPGASPACLEMARLRKQSLRFGLVAWQAGWPVVPDGEPRPEWSYVVVDPAGRVREVVG